MHMANGHLQMTIAQLGFLASNFFVCGAHIAILLIDDLGQSVAPCIALCTIAHCNATSIMQWSPQSVDSAQSFVFLPILSLAKAPDFLVDSFAFSFSSVVSGFASFWFILDLFAPLFLSSASWGVPHESFGKS